MAASELQKRTRGRQLRRYQDTSFGEISALCANCKLKEKKKRLLHLLTQTVNQGRWHFFFLSHFLLRFFMHRGDWESLKCSRSSSSVCVPSVSTAWHWLRTIISNSQELCPVARWLTVHRWQPALSDGARTKGLLNSCFWNRVINETYWFFFSCPTIWRTEVHRKVKKK